MKRKSRALRYEFTGLDAPVYGIFLSLSSLRDFQTAHRILLCKYISAIDAAFGLPFCVKLTKLLVPQKKGAACAMVNRQIWFLFAPVPWKLFVRFLVEMHVKAKMGEWSIAYNQLALRLPAGKKYDPFQQVLWLAATECHPLSRPITTVPNKNRKSPCQFSGRANIWFRIRLSRYRRS